MRRGTTVFVAGGLLLFAACTRTVVVQPGPDRGLRGSRPPPRTPPEPDRPAPPPPQPPVRTLEVLIPPGHLPDPGACRVWIPGTPPGRQPRPRSRPCAGIEAVAPAGSWIVVRPTEDRRLVYLRVVDERRPGIVIRNRIFDLDSWELVREDEMREDARPGDRPREERPRDERPPQPPTPPPPPAVRDTTRPREQRPPLPPMEIIRPVPPPPAVRDTARPPENRPPENRPPIEQPPPPVRDTAQPPPPPPVPALTLDIPPGHLPEVGECRVWIPGLPPGQQAKPKSRTCAGITSVAPAGSWIIHLPSDDRTVVHVRLVDERRPGVVIRIRIFDIETRRLLREATP